MKIWITAVHLQLTQHCKPTVLQLKKAPLTELKAAAWCWVLYWEDAWEEQSAPGGNRLFYLFLPILREALPKNLIPLGFKKCLFLMEQCTENSTYTLFGFWFEQTQP